MRVIYPAGNLTLPADRNPLGVTLVYDALESVQTAITTRATYTVPVGRRAEVGGILLSLEVKVVLGSATEVVLQVTRNPAGSNENVAKVNNYLVTVGTKDRVGFYSGLILSAGQILTIRSAFGPASGGVHMVANVSLMEYDA